MMNEGFSSFKLITLALSLENWALTWYFAQSVMLMTWLNRFCWHDVCSGVSLIKQWSAVYREISYHTAKYEELYINSLSDRNRIQVNKPSSWKFQLINRDILPAINTHWPFLSYIDTYSIYTVIYSQCLNIDTFVLIFWFSGFEMKRSQKYLSVDCQL